MVMIMMVMMMHPLCNILVQDLTLGAPHGQAPVGGVQTILLKHYHPYTITYPFIYLVSTHRVESQQPRLGRGDGEVFVQSVVLQILHHPPGEVLFIFR